MRLGACRSAFWSSISTFRTLRHPIHNITRPNNVFGELARVRVPTTPYCHDCQLSSRQSDSDTWVVDIRSDTLSQPTEAVRKALLMGTTNDDVFDEDTTVHELQRHVAEILGMEAGLFVPSGTMGNLISMLCYCGQRGKQVIVGDECHMMTSELGGMAQLGGILPRTIANKPDGTFDLDKVSYYIRPPDDPRQPATALVCVENTHGYLGGKVLPMEYLKELRELSRALSVPVYMDGARVWNAAVCQRVEPREITQYVDCLTVCLSKGIGAPVGSIVAGSQAFMKQARRVRKALGGGWRQPGPLAAAALASLKDYRTRMAEDQRRAKVLAEGIMSGRPQGVAFVDLDGVHTNIVNVEVIKPGVTAAEFCARLRTTTTEEEKTLNERISVLGSPIYKQVVRFTVCLNQSDDDILRAVRKLCYVIDEYHNVT